jgi:hypothetical protein
LKYERQQRLYSELGAVAGKLRQVQEGESGAESDDEGAQLFLFVFAYFL